MQQREMPTAEAEQYFHAMVQQVRVYNPDEIIGVARSGLALAQWTAELLNLPLGFYEPNTQQFVCQPQSQRLVFVDDNCVSGETYQEVKQWLTQHHPTKTMKWAVLFSDAVKTAQATQQEIIQGTVLDYFALGPIYGSRKQIKGQHIRRRDE